MKLAQVAFLSVLGLALSAPLMAQQGGGPGKGPGPGMGQGGGMGPGKGMATLQLQQGQYARAGP